MYYKSFSKESFTKKCPFYITHVFDVFASYGGEGCGLEGNRLGTKNEMIKRMYRVIYFLEWHI